MTQKDRRESLAGRWPVADPNPAIIELLQYFQAALNRCDAQGAVHLDYKSRADLLTKLAAILDPWEAREDLDELRKILGVSPSRGRRRTQRTVDREYGMAFAAYTRLHGGDTAAVKTIAAEADVDEKTVRRAMNKWANVEETVKLMYETHPGARIDYSSMLHPDKK